MSGNQLAKFFATVGFKADTSGFDAAVKKIKKDVAGISTTIRGSPAVKRATALSRARDRVKAETSLLEAGKIKSLRLREENRPKTAAFNKEMQKLQAKTLHQDSMTSRLRQSGAYAQIKADAAQRTIASRIQQSQQKVVEVGARTAQVQARTAQTHARTQLAAGNLSLQNARNEALRMRNNTRSSIGMGGRSGAGNAALTGGVGGMSAKGMYSGLAAAGFAQQSFKVGNFMMSRKPQFEFLTGSAEEATKQIKFVDDEAKRLSLDLIQANEQYKQLLASGSTSIGIEKTQKLFSGFSEMSTMMGLSTDAQNRGMRAFAQIDVVCCSSNRV